MKTVPFNEADAKAGRPVVRVSDGHKVNVHAVHANRAWVTLDGYSDHYTTAFSYLCHPADPAPGHNRAGLDEWTVETRDGWRLLEAGEVCNRQPTPDIEVWRESTNSWWAPFSGSNPKHVYRTLKPPGYFLPRPKTRMIRQDELPEVFLWKEKEDMRPSITHRSSWTLEEIESAARDGWQWSRSLDGPWRPFTVEEAP